MIGDNFKHTEITGKIIKAYYNVYNTLGYGFLEKVYENAMMIELQKAELECEKQKPITVYYNNLNIGDYFADLIVENKVIIELKACQCLTEVHESQIVNYLRATDLEVGLLLNFGPEVEYKRKVLSNEFKNRKIAITN